MKKLKLDISKILCALSTLLVILFIILPVITIISSQIHRDSDALINVFTSHHKLSIILFTFYCGLISTIIGVLIGTPLAYLLARFNFYGKSFIEAILDIPVILPHTVAGIMLLSVFGTHGLIGEQLAPLVKFVDSQAGIIVAMLFVSLPFYINYAKEGFKSLDPRLEAVARTLGATHFQAIVKVTIPLTAHHLFTGALMSWARAISEFGAVVVIAYFPVIAPTLVYQEYISYGLRSSQPVAVSIIILCLSIFFFLKYLSRRLFYYDSIE